MVTSPADISQRSEGLRRKKSVDKLFTTFGRATTVSGSCLALLFAWIKLRNLPMPSLQDADPLLILHFFLALAFASYMLAVTFEIGIHRAVYVDDPMKGRLTPDIAASMLLMTAGAALVFWASQNGTYFPAAVVFFIFTDVVLWRRTAGRFKAMIRSSRSFYGKHELFELEKLNLLEQHVIGRWRWYRLAVTLGAALALCAISYVDRLKVAAAAALHSLLPNLPLASATSLAPVVVFGVGLAVVEGWVWFARMRLSISIAVIEDLRQRYKLALSQAP